MTCSALGAAATPCTADRPPRRSLTSRLQVSGVASSHARGHSTVRAPLAHSSVAALVAGFACPEQLSPTVFLLELLGGHPHVSAPREGSRAEAGAVNGGASGEGTTRLASQANGGGDADACAHELLRALAQLWCLHLETAQSERQQSKLQSTHGESLPLPAARRQPRFLVQLRLYTRRACMLVLRRWRKTSLE